MPTTALAPVWQRCRGVIVGGVLTAVAALVGSVLAMVMIPAAAVIGGATLAVGIVAMLVFGSIVVAVGFVGVRLVVTSLRGRPRWFTPADGTMSDGASSLGSSTPHW